MPRIARLRSALAHVAGLSARGAAANARAELDSADAERAQVEVVLSRIAPIQARPDRPSRAA